MVLTIISCVLKENIVLHINAYISQYKLKTDYSCNIKQNFQTCILTFLLCVSPLIIVTIFFCALLVKLLFL